MNMSLWEWTQELSPTLNCFDWSQEFAYFYYYKRTLTCTKVYPLHKIVFRGVSLCSLGRRKIWLQLTKWHLKLEIHQQFRQVNFTINKKYVLGLNPSSSWTSAISISSSKKNLFKRIACIIYCIYIQWF